MKILITGGAGFIGSRLSHVLIEKGHEIKVIDNLSTGRMESLGNLPKSPFFQFKKGCVTQRDILEPWIEWCDHCYHLAAPVGVKLIMEKPVLTILDNIRAIDAILELVQKYEKKLLVASTSEVYGRSLDFLDSTGERKLKEEDYRIEGSTKNHRWAYANTKSMDEFLSFAYHKEFGTEVVIARLFNTVGPGQLSDFGMVIPNFVEQALRQENITVFGTGAQKRSFIHVSDVVKALIDLMDSQACVGEEFNIGNPFEVTIADLAQLIVQKTNSSSKVVFIPYEEAYGAGFEDMQRRTADVSKLKRFIDFEFEFNLNDIIEDVIAEKKTQLKLDV